MIGKRYTAQFKITMVEEYLKQKENQPKLTIAEFASKNNIPDSTFNDWVVKYKRQGQGFCNITNEIRKLDYVEVIDTEPVGSVAIREVTDENIPMAMNRVRMKYNGAVIEFDESLLERALTILKSW